MSGRCHLARRGALTLRFSTERAEMPRTRGTLMACAGWTKREAEPAHRAHSVEPVRQRVGTTAAIAMISDD